MPARSKTIRSGLVWLFGMLLFLPAAVYAGSQESLDFRQNETIPPGDAAVTVAHFAPFADTKEATAVTVRINQQDALTDFQFGDIVTDVILAAGTYSITVLPAAAPTGTVALSGTVSLDEGVRYTLAAIGDGANQPLELFTLIDEREAPSQGANVRIAHLAPFAATLDETRVDICTDDNTVVVNALPYKGVTDYLNLEAGDYNLKIALAGTDCQEVALDLPSIRLSNGEVVELYAIGDITNQPLQIASTTGYTVTPGPGERPQITIVVEAEPESRRNFIFGGDLGAFKLDDPRNGDDDKVRKRRHFRVDPGTYNVGEDVPYRWILRDIQCEGGSTTVNLAGAFVTIVANLDDEITCTFFNQRDSTLRVRKYHDANDNSQLDRGERRLPGFVMTLYDEQGNTLASSATNIFGKSNFRFLTPGRYIVCETPLEGWINTQPGRLNPNFDNRPCYTFTTDPAKITYLRFGNLDNVTAAAPIPRSEEVYLAGMTVVADPYEDDDDASYRAPDNDIDLDLLQPDDDDFQDPGLASQLYLPLIQR
jgi:hypothetical protein